DRRDEHADARPLDTAARGHRRGHPLDAHDEEHRRGEVARLDQVEDDLIGVHRLGSSAYFFELLNISSIRSVTTYPPAALPAPRNTPSVPIAICSGVVASPSAIIAPTSTIPCTKFEPDISGVCRITGPRAM